MDASHAGDFQIVVSEPYPAWCAIIYMGTEVCRIHHSELSDLRYAVEKAMQIAAIKLKSREEVFPT